MVVFLNNEFVDEEKASLGIKDLSIQRGYGIFDFFRTSNFIPLFLDDYLERFFKSAQLCRLPLPYTKEGLKDVLSEMIKLNKIADAGFKMILTGGYSTDGYELSSPNFIIIEQPVEMLGKDNFERGISIILHEYMRELPQVKSINYLVGVYLQDKVKQHKADDVLYYQNEFVLEFPRSNVFIVTKDQKVITPVENVLRGITRMKVLELAKRNGYLVEERPTTVEEVRNAAEVFLTSTTKRILPVLKVDGFEIGDGQVGEITRNLSKAFFSMEESVIKKFKLI